MSGTVRVTRSSHASVPEWVWMHPEVLPHPTALLVYVALYHAADFKTRLTPSDWPEVCTLTGLSKRTVMRGMAQLRKAGAVLREGNHLRLPLDDPSAKYDTGDGQICHKTMPNMATALFSTENSKKGAEAPNPEVATLCALLAQRIAAYRGEPDALPKVTTAWLRDMDLLVRRGPPDLAEPVPTDPQRVRRGIEYLFNHLAEPNGHGDFCWAKVIQNPAKLRKHWQAIRDAAKTTNGNVASASTNEHFPMAGRLEEHPWR